jgi:DNA mismatch repair protein MutL
MEADEVDLAFAQHATSKVETIADLDGIETMGFRGEALASIASVSRIELITGTGAGAGVRVRMNGGEGRTHEQVPWPRGTTVRVGELFFNTPARRKNLKTRATELRHASQVTMDYALCRPDIHLTLEHGKRTLLAAPPVSSLAERVHAVLGAQAAEHWLPVEGRRGTLRVTGGVTSPEHQRPNRNDIRWFVNGRPVSDYRLAHALVSAYDSLLDTRRFPAAALFLELPLEEVDVNVHPRKAEVRFADPSGVYRTVRAAVRESLARHLPPVRIHPRDEQPATRSGGDRGFGAPSGGGWRSRAFPPGSGGGGASGSRSLPVEDWIVSESGAGARAPESDEADSAEGGIRGTAGAIRPLAQYDNTYIVAADRAGLLVIDQHVAHERVLYEQVLSQLESRGVEAQHLLVPETIDLSAAEVAAVESHGAVLESLGFAIEPFGGRSWAVRTVPAILGNRNPGETVRALLASLSQGAGAEALDEVRREMAASIACHAAVRANHPLSREEMVRLIADLERCDAPTRCPHGRPILVRVDHDELERRIGRH